MIIPIRILGDPVLKTPAKPVEDSGSVPRSEMARRTGYRRRFAIVYGALAVVGGIAIGALIVLVSRPDAVPNPSWSSA